MKPRIERHRTETGDLGQGWDLVRPPYGFSSKPEVSNHLSREAAGRALAAHLGSGSRAQLTERQVANFTPGIPSGKYPGYQQRRPRWFE